MESIHQLLWRHGDFLGISWSAWKIVGWVGNLIFASRFPDSMVCDGEAAAGVGAGVVLVAEPGGDSGDARIRAVSFAGFGGDFRVCAELDSLHSESDVSLPARARATGLPGVRHAVTTERAFLRAVRGEAGCGGGARLIFADKAQGQLFICPGAALPVRLDAMSVAIETSAPGIGRMMSARRMLLEENLGSPGIVSAFIAWAGWWKLGLSIEEIGERLSTLTPAEIHAALAYYPPAP